VLSQVDQESPPAPSQAPSPAAPPNIRALSVDAFRGLVMVLMLAEVLKTCAVSARQPASGLWSFLCQQQTHAAWVGASLHDLIQPGFFFIVGVSLSFSIAARRQRGQAFGGMLGHALRRSLILIGLGLFIIAMHPRQWIWQFDDTLTQIGLAYPFAFLLAFRPPTARHVALGAILVGYWLWFALTPLPAPDFDYPAVGVSSAWLQEHGLEGFAAHWQKNSNPAAAFDRWFLNLFPRDHAYAGVSGGLTTLNFIPSMATMLLGLIAGDLLRSGRAPGARVRALGIAGAALLGTGWALGALGVSPVVKAIWTPSWVLFSAGWCFLILAALHALVDIAGWRSGILPLAVVGANSIVAYLMAHAYPTFAYNSLRRVVGEDVFRAFGDDYTGFVYGGAILLGYWLILLALYRMRLFVRI
jgi:predicted acyltransferase